MNALALTIGGRRITIACAPGEEDRVRALAMQVERRFEPLAPRFSHNLLFAALRLADELQEAKTHAARLQAASDHGTLFGRDQADLAPALERFADLLEDCASKLESGAERA